MASKLDIVGETGLQFYGKMSASLSHEIKNALSVIQEHAGLVEDFTVMAEQGIPINIERVKTLAGKIKGQIDRANGIIKGMNQLAHSMDESVKSVELGEVLTLLVTLSHRFASVRGIILEAKPLPTGVTIRTSLFFLQNLAWLCLDFAMYGAGKKKTVGLSAEKTELGAKLRFTQLEGLADAPIETFPGEREKALLEILNGEVTTDIGTQEIVLTLPGDLNL